MSLSRTLHRDGVTEPLRDWEGAFHFAGIYVFRFWILGLIPTAIFALMAGLGSQGLGVGMIVLVVTGLVGMALWPGSVLLTRAVIRMCPSRTWNHEPWRAWLAATLTTALLWLTPLILNTSFPDPPGFLRAQVGNDWAWFLWISGLILGASGVSQAFVWSLPSTPRTAPITRPTGSRRVTG